MNSINTTKLSIKQAVKQATKHVMSAIAAGWVLSGTYAQAAGTCSYTQWVSIPSGNRTAHVIAVDLNKDGKPDIVGSNQGGMSTDKGTITVVLNKGKGQFAPPVQYTLGNAGPYETTAADYNGDGYPDLAVELFGTSDRTIVGNEIDVFINKGDGTFKPFVAYASGQKPRAVVSGDMNGDGKQDLIVANSINNSVGVLLGKGDGTFGPRKDFPAGGNTHGVVVADFNKDGRLDAALANNAGNGGANVLLGKGDGTFADTIQYEAGTGTFSIDAGDFNGDGYPDIVTANERAKSLSVLINTGKGTFNKPVDYPASGKQGGALSVTVGDLNKDGKLDLISSVSNIRAETEGGYTDILFGNGDGTFQAPLNVATGSGTYDAAVADFDGDGSMDFVSAVSTGSVVVMKGACK
ncbi:MAG: VCBS repeat-containing protein [Steroidobacteraceae bacterium]